MNNQKNLRELVNAMYDHRFVTINLTNGQSVKGQISGMSDTAFSIGLNPRNRNRFSLDRVESVKLFY
jgi:sRNA-binding regulator protein Hfq